MISLFVIVIPCATHRVLLAGENAVRFRSSPLHISARKGQTEKIRGILKSGGNINARDEYGKTALHYAAENGHVEATRLLLREGANPDIPDGQGHTALQLALDNNHTAIASVLADVTKIPPTVPDRQTLNPSLKYPDLRSFERTIGRPACLLKGDHVWLFAPKALEAQARVVHEYLSKAYDALYDIVGVHTRYIMVVYNFPKGHRDAFGGTTNCTIWYDDTNLRFNQHEEWRRHGVPHVSGYIEEMAHNFNYTQFGWEMVGWSIGVKASLKVANNPTLAQAIENTRKKQAETFVRYQTLGYTFPADIPANLVDRIHAHLLWQCERKYGPTFWRDFFREAKKHWLQLRLGSRDERYQITIDCFDQLPGINFKQLLRENRISLTRDIQSLKPTGRSWNRKLE
jgi:hypothetical protein